MQNSNLKMQNYKSPPKADPPSEEKFKINKFKHLSLRAPKFRGEAIPWPISSLRVLPKHRESEAIPLLLKNYCNVL